MSDFLVVILASSSAGLLSLSVALILLGSEKLSSKLVKYGTPFAAGVLLIIAFRDLLPEAIIEDGADVLNAALGAILIFFLIEKGFKSFHHHHEEDKLEEMDTTQGWLFVIGDIFHNLIDGISLGGAFLIGRDTGLVATVALIAHDIPLEVGEFGNQLRVGFTKRQTILRNILSGSTTIVGAILTYQIGGDLDIPMGYLYGGIAGFFIYIALSDIVPTIHSSEKTRYGLQTGFLLFGLIFGGTVSALAHDYIDVGHSHDEEGHDDHDEEGHDDHDEEGHDDHDEEGHDDHDEEGHDEVTVPEALPEKLQVINYNLGDEVEINFISNQETEIHVHGYDRYLKVYPNQDNILEIDLNIAGEFEIEDHNGNFEFVRLKVSP
jgi:zinc and cadmium transporter